MSLPTITITASPLRRRQRARTPTPLQAPAAAPARAGEGAQGLPGRLALSKGALDQSRSERDGRLRLKRARPAAKPPPWSHSGSSGRARAGLQGPAAMGGGRRPGRCRRQPRPVLDRIDSISAAITRWRWRLGRGATAGSLPPAAPPHGAGRCSGRKRGGGAEGRRLPNRWR